MSTQHDGELQRKPNPPGAGQHRQASIRASQDPPPGASESARAALNAKLQAIAANHSGYAAGCTSLSLTRQSVTLRLSIQGPAIWSKVAPTHAQLETRIRDMLAAKYGGDIHVSVREGSIDILVIVAAIDALKAISEIIQSIFSITEYVVRCIERSRFEWPSITTVFSVFELLKRFLLGL